MQEHHTLIVAIQNQVSLQQQLLAAQAKNQRREVGMSLHILVAVYTLYSVWYSVLSSILVATFSPRERRR
jgi:hypothetical protein